MSFLPLPEEKELLLRMSAGDEAALAMIYKHYWQPLYTAAFNILKDRNACEDVIQDIFLQLWRNRQHLEIRDSLKAYLYAATRYQVFRQIKNLPQRHDLFDKLAEKCGTDAADEQLLNHELVNRVHEGVAALPEKCREVYRLSREEYLSHKEIAFRLNISTKTVENQLTIALRRLRYLLRDTVACWLYLLVWILD